MAVEFTKANPNCTEAELEKLEKAMTEAAEKGIGATRCIKFGCSEDQIAKCHKKIIRDDKGEISNSPSYFIREENLKKYEARKEFEALKDEILERITSGDKNAHMDENFINACAALKASDSTEFVKLKDQLKETGAKMAAFDEDVNKQAKTISKTQPSVEAQAVELPEHLKPFGEGVDYSTFFVDENGHIIAMVKEKADSYPMQASNFVARIDVREFDDGVETAQQFSIKGLRDGTKELPTVTVNAQDFRSMSWAEKYWGNILITSAPKARDVIRETIMRVSLNAPVTKVHYPLGWKNIDEVWYYLFSGGSIGGYNVSVAEIIWSIRKFQNRSYDCAD